MVSNIIIIIICILGNFQMLTNCGILDPVFYVDVLLKLPENTKPFEDIICGDVRVPNKNMLKSLCTDICDWS